jgi:hypothetical protein
MRRNRIFGSAQRQGSNRKNTQVLQDILDTLDVCNDSDELFDFLKNTLLGQFGKSKWQSYFELLHLHMEMQGLKPSVLMGTFGS